MIDKKAPDFEAEAYIDGRFGKVKLSDYKGKWLVLLFYPEDFSYVCPTELQAFAEDDKLPKLNVSVVAASSDSLFSHRAWFTSGPDMKKIRYPVISDRKGELAQRYGVLNELTGNARRGLFIIDPTGTIKYMAITDDTIGRSTKETHRIIAALQTGAMCGADWEPGEPTIREV